MRKAVEEEEQQQEQKVTKRSNAELESEKNDF
jgi:hypothetical protein